MTKSLFKNRLAKQQAAKTRQISTSKCLRTTMPIIRAAIVLTILLLQRIDSNAQTRRYVDSANTSGTYNGTSWATAYNKLETAITAAVAGDTIWVAKGTYQPQFSGGTYVMKNGVAIYGGFLNTDVSFSQRNWVTRSTVLRGNNSRVFYNYFGPGAPLLSSAVLDGFTIANGTNTSIGSGMYNYYASPTLSNLIFRNNVCSSSGYATGGAMYIFVSSSVLTNVTFEANKSNSSSGQAQGGAIYAVISNLTMSNVVFSGNSAESGSDAGCYSQGGAIYNISGTLNINKAVFSRNACVCTNAQARTYGGAVYSSGAGATPNLFTNTIFNENVSSWGAVFYNASTANTVVNATFCNNKGVPSYYGIYESTSTLKLANCIFYKMPSVYATSPVVFTANNCFNSGSFSGVTSASTGNITSSVSPFMNPNTPEGPDGLWFTADDGLRLRNGLAAAISPIDKGLLVDAGTYTSTVADNATRDILGVARPQSAAYDMGAYEGGFDKVNRFYVDSANVAGVHNGLAWATAFNKLEDINAVAGSDDTVWVAKGTYQPAPGASFSIPNGTAVYGGFDNAATLFSHRNRLINKTILTGNGNSVVRNDLAGKLALTTTSILDGFIITGGTATNGGGIYNNFASPAINNIVFRNNSATAAGGGVYNANSSSPVIVNCVFQENTAGSTGGGVSNHSGSAPNIANITFHANSANDGGGIYNNAASPQIVNTIFWQNTGVIPDVKSVGGTPSVTYSYTQSSAPDATSIQVTTSPFVNSAQPAGPDGIWMTADDGLRLVYGYTPSPVNTGKVLNTYDPITFTFTLAIMDSVDIIGTRRYIGKGYDIGAYEYVPATATRYYVDSSNTGDRRDGLSWLTAYPRLEDALAEDGLASGDTIWVAKGAYSPQTGKHYTMQPGVAIYGGFTNATNAFSQRDWISNKTILKGNNRSVFRNRYSAAVPLTRAAVLDGFTITGGRDSIGGGMYNVQASPTLSNLIFYADTAWLYSGGGLYNSNSSPLLTNVQFIENVAQGWGGGVDNTLSSPVFNNVIFLRNRGQLSTSSGGGMYNWNSSPTLDRVVFDGNIAGNEGGGMFVQNQTSFPVLSNVIFYGNSANNGGGLYSTGVLRMKNTIFSQNVATATGGGAYLPSSVNPPTPVALYNKITNCAFWGNTTPASTQSDKVSNFTSLFKHCYLQTMPGNSDSATNIRGSVSPFLNDALPRGADGIWLTADDGLQLNFCSPALDAGINDSVTNIATDVLGRPRIKNTRVDIGAYEKQSNTGTGQYSSNAALSNGASNGQTFASVCDDNGWTFYANPANPDSLGFAINWGSGNAAAKAAARIFITVDNVNTGIYNTTSGIWTMRRYWNVDLNGASLADPVQVRFYYNPADTLAMYDSAQAANITGRMGHIEWFKTTSALFTPALVSTTDINGGNKIVMLPQYGRDNDVYYAQFNGVGSFSGGTAALTIGAAVPLPVNLLSFVATFGENKQRVNAAWQVGNEVPGHYEIERSIDGVSFQMVGTVKASGKTIYTFSDEQLPGATNHPLELFYRLRMIEMNGNSSYSQVVKLTFDGTQNSLTVSPNPATSKIVIANTNAKYKDRNGLVTDAMGRVIYRFMLNEKLEVNVSQWSNGIYFISVGNGSVIKLIKE